MNDNLNMRTAPGCSMTSREVFEQMAVVSRLASDVEHVDQDQFDQWEREIDHERA